MEEIPGKVSAGTKLPQSVDDNLLYRAVKPSEDAVEKEKRKKKTKPNKKQSKAATPLPSLNTSPSPSPKQNQTKPNKNQIITPATKQNKQSILWNGR